MKILQIIPDLNLAGAETMCENLTNELKKEHEVAIISFYSNHTDITNRLEKKGIKIFYLDKKKGPNIKLIKKIKNVINEFNPDVIHTHRYCLEYVYPAVRISNNKNIKIVHTVHNIAEKEVPKIRRILRKLFILKKNVVLVAISDIIQKTISEEYNIDLNKIPVVLNGVNLQNCIVKENYTKNNILLNIGRLSEQKNHTFLIDIFEKIHKRYPDYKLKIIGDGPLENEITKRIKDARLDKNVIIEKSKPSCYEDLNNSDVFIMTSKWEGVPMTIIEAMGTGVPIVASNVGGIPNMLNENEGIVIPLDLDVYFQEICKLIDNKKLRINFGKNALQKSKKFSSIIMAKKYLKIYNK